MSASACAAPETRNPLQPPRIPLRGVPAEVSDEVENEAELIPSAKLRTLFDSVKRFAIRPASERVASGTENLGLGLYVVKQIVVAHKGEVSVSSSKDDGVAQAVRVHNGATP